MNDFRVPFVRLGPVTAWTSLAVGMVGAVACTSPERQFAESNGARDAAVDSGDAQSSFTGTEASGTEQPASDGGPSGDTTTSSETGSGERDGGEPDSSAMGNSSATGNSSTTGNSSAGGDSWCDAGCSEASCDTCEAGSTEGACGDCDDNATCSDAAGSSACECNSGYTGDGFTCTNIDECDEGTHDCGDGESCRDTIGSFTCDCKSGSVRNAGACVPQLMYIDFHPTAVNPDGTVVAGFDGSKAWRWTQADGTAQALEGSSLSALTRVVAVTADGLVTIATSTGAIARWVGTVRSESQASGTLEPMDASDNGTVIVGTINALSAFVWNVAEAQPSQLLIEATGSSAGRAFAVSSDGNIVTGRYPALGSDLAFLLDLRQPDALRTLGTPDTFSNSAGFALSADGEIVVGAAWSGETFIATRWQGETVATLAAPSGMTVTRATSTSSDGARIVGDDLATEHLHPPHDKLPTAIYWPSPTTQGVRLHSHVESLGIDVEDVAELRDATISDDGKTIVGAAELAVDSSKTRGFILRLP